MKTATMPALRAQPELRHAAKKILLQEFIARGLASRDAAKKSGVYFSSEEVLAELDAIIAVRHQREDDYL